MKINMTISCRKLFQVVYSVLAIFVLSNCQKVINVDLNEAEPRLVIEGLITDRPGPYTIKISKSGSYFDQPVLPPVTDAEVIITDNNGSIDTLKEINPGIYITLTTRGIPGRTYTLKVLSDSKVYSGSSTMNSHVDIDFLKLVKNEFLFFDFDNQNKDELRLAINCFFKDPTEKNFYRIIVFKNDTTKNENYRLFDDQFNNGQKIELQVTRAKALDSYRVELHSLDKLTFEYYRTLVDLLYANPLFGSTPANPNTNLDNGALGYFGTCAVSSKTIIVTDSLINLVK